MKHHNSLAVHNEEVSVSRSFHRAIVAISLTGFIGTCLSVTPALAASPYQCESGPNDAIVAACAGRWEASNIRAHVAAGDFGGATAECLSKTAALLENLAAKYAATNKVTTFAGPWPCGREPKIAKADDGALASACQGKSWTYGNQGKVACNMQAGLAPSASTPAVQSKPIAVATAEPCPEEHSSNADSAIAWQLYFNFHEQESLAVGGVETAKDYAELREGLRKYRHCDPDFVDRHLIEVDDFESGAFLRSCESRAGCKKY
jgi:hypothetical protein